MTRKGKKAPGGHNPLTYHERSKLTYGTTTARLNTESQRRFGDCCLGLQPATVDPVCTPSGHIYSREAIVSYLLAKNRDLKRQKAEYDAQVAASQAQKNKQTNLLAIESLDQFAKKDQGAIRQTDQKHMGSFQTQLRNKISIETQQEGRAILKRTSYWLSENQPQYDSNQDILTRGPPPQRPSSPMSGNPLRLKDLIPLQLQIESCQSQKTNQINLNNQPRFICAVSGKAITTQPVIAIKNTGQVMLKSVYESLAKPTMICPVTNQKFKSKDVIALQKAASGFAASGKVEAKRYRPTLT